VKQGFHIRLRAKNLADGRASFTAVAFREGRPLHNPGKRTYGMGRKGQGLRTLHSETPEQADAVVARAAHGTVRVTAEYVEAPQGLFLEKGDIPGKSGKELHPVEDKPVRLVLRDDPSDGRDTRGSLGLYRGRAQHKEKLEDVAYTLENGAGRTWIFPSDRQMGTLNVDVWEGGVAFRMEQPRTGGMPEDWRPAREAESAGKTPPDETKTAAAAEADRPPETPAGTGPEAASGAPNILFILDASGSMWGEVEGRDKIAIAKEVMTELIRELPDRARVGLMAYGHRRKGDCSDVEELVAVSPLDRDRLTRTVQAISPKGKTPITRSVRTAAETLKALEEETTIVLVSDGKETCEGDPCALVRELKEAGLRFVLHVIGFDVTEEERRQLECMAGAGGGTYFTAKTAHEFRAAAREVVKKRPEQGFLRVSAVRSGEPFEALVEVLPAGGGDVLKEGRTGTAPDRPGAPVKPGTYDVRVWDENLRSRPEVWLRDVEVEAGRTTDVEAVFDPVGVLELAVTKEGEPFDAMIRVRPAGSDRNVVHASLDRGEGRFELDPGPYDVLVVDESVPSKPEIRLQDVQVEAGRTTRKELVFVTSGVLELAATKGGEPFRAKVRVYPAGSDHNVVHAGLRGGSRSWELAAGAYDVVFVDESVPSEPEIRLRDVRVEGGQTTRKEAAFPENGVLELSATKGGEPFRAKVRVYPEGRDNNVVHTRLREEPRQFELAAGTYDVLFQDMEAEGKPEVWVRGVVLEPGGTVRKAAEFAP
jgi:Ca-activated chloride channel family protein